MAHSQKDNAVAIPGHGYILIGDDVDTTTQPTLADINAFVADISDLPTGWKNLGHTDIDEILTFGQEGGETEVKRSWQNEALRETITETAVDFFTVQSLQLIDNDVLSLFYGGGDATVADEFSLPDTSAVTEKPALVILVDATNGNPSFYCPKTSIRRDAEIGMAFDDWVKLPLRFTVLQKSGAKRGKWLHASLGA